MTAHAPNEKTISDRLDQLAENATGGTVSLDWIMEQLHERAFGLFLLVLALPCCIPFLYGIPQIVSLPLMFVSAQILMGRQTPWLPERLAARTVSAEGLENLAHRADPWLRRIEAFSRPRQAHWTRPPLDRIVGLALVLFSASILVPLPTLSFPFLCFPPLPLPSLSYFFIPSLFPPFPLSPLPSFTS